MMNVICNLIYIIKLKYITLYYIIIIYYIILYFIILLKMFINGKLIFIAFRWHFQYGIFLVKMFETQAFSTRKFSERIFSESFHFLTFRFQRTDFRMFGADFPTFSQHFPENTSFSQHYTENLPPPPIRIRPSCPSTCPHFPGIMLCRTFPTY